MLVFCDLCLFFHVFIKLPAQGAEAAQRLWVRDFYNVMQDIFVLNDFVPSKDVNMTSSQWFFNLFFFFFKLGLVSQLPNYMVAMLMSIE